jgi:hypothetical protein
MSVALILSPFLQQFNNTAIQNMKFKVIYILFCLFFLQNTEGYAQAVDTTTGVEAVPTAEEMDTSHDEPLEDEIEKPYTNPFDDAAKKYYSEDVKQQEFDKETYQKATAGLDYSVEKKEEKRPVKQSKETPNFYISPFWAQFFQWFFIFGAVLLVGFLVYKFVDGGNVFTRGSRKIRTDSVDIDLEKIEENLQEIELDPHIKKAIAQKQFALATRLYYLAIIKELSAKNIIVWKKDKTNRAYLFEMRDHKHLKNFKTMTGIYERVWYGDTPIDEPSFMTIQPAFQDLLKILRG